MINYLIINDKNQSLIFFSRSLPANKANINKQCWLGAKLTVTVTCIISKFEIVGLPVNFRLDFPFFLSLSSKCRSIYLLQRCLLGLGNPSLQSITIKFTTDRDLNNPKHLIIYFTHTEIISLIEIRVALCTTSKVVVLVFPYCSFKSARQNEQTDFAV